MAADTLRDRVRWMVDHWKVYRRELPLLLTLTVVNAGVVMVYPLMVKRIIDGIVTAQSEAYLNRNALVLLVFGLGHFMLYGRLQWMRSRLNLRFQFGIRLRAFEYLTRLGAGFFGQFRTGDLVTRLNDDINDKLAWYMCSGIFRVVEALTIILFGTVAMLWISPSLTLVAAGPLPLLIVLFVASAIQLHHCYAEVQQSISQLNDALESCFSGIRVVKAFSAENRQRDLVYGAIEANRRAEVRAVRWQTVVDSLYANVWQLAVVGLLLWGGGAVIAGRVSLGDLVAMQSLITMLVWPMFDVGQFLVRGRLSAVSIDRIAEVEQTVPEVLVRDEPPAVARAPDAAKPEDYAAPRPVAGGLNIALREVSYRYPGSESLSLENVSLAVEPGQFAAVAGPTGSGKSTLLSLLPRLMDPLHGQVLAAGRQLRDWDVIELRQSIGFVPQEPLLLSGSVLENIRFGRQWISDDDLSMAIDVCRLREDLGQWPHGLETIVGSRGLRLSGGQKQRVALARAVAGRPRLLLLDDCTASLDAATEEAVWQQLFRALGGCTTVLVTHRPATLRRADQIIVLDEGRVCQHGTFKDVEIPDTLFHRLYVQWNLDDRLSG